jgi:hypothetical protein
VKVQQSKVPLIGNSACPTSTGAPGPCHRQRWGDYSGLTTICRSLPYVTCDYYSEVFGFNEKIDNPDDPFGFTWGTDEFHATSP